MTGFVPFAPGRVPIKGLNSTNQSHGITISLTNYIVHMVVSFHRPNMRARIDGAAVAATAWIAFANSLSGQFVWDDRGAILNNLDVHSDVSSLQDLLVHDFWGMNLSLPQSHKSFRPLTVLTFRLNYMVDGLHPWGYHLVNVFLHAVASVLVVFTGRALFGREHSAPLLAGLLFAAHPIHCDSVASVVGRADILCTVLSLVAFLTHHQGLDHPSISVWRVIATIVCVVSATLAKESGVTTFAILLALEVYHHCRSTTSTSRWRRLGRCTCLVLAAAATIAWRISLNGQHKLFEWSIYENEFVHLPRGTQVLSYAHVHALYLWKLLWPHHLCYDYGWKTIDAISSVWDVRNAGTIVAYGVVLGGSAIVTMWANHLFVVVALALCPFVPASHVFFPVGTILAERLLYFPSVGFSLGVGCVLAHAVTASSAPLGRVLRGVYVILLLLALGRTVRRNQDWHNEASLFGSALEVAPTSVKVLTNVGKERRITDPARAAFYLDVAVDLMPQNGLAHLNLAAAYGQLEKPLHAMQHLVHAIALEAQPKAYTALSQHLVAFWETHATQKGEASKTLEMAASFIQEAMERGETSPSMYYGQAKVAYAKGQAHDTIAWLHRTLEANRRVAARGYDVDEQVDGCFIDTMLGLAWEKTQLVPPASETDASVSYNDVYASLLPRHDDMVACLTLVNNAAAYWHRRGRAQDALALIQAAVTRHPSHEVLWANAGFMAESLGDAVLARECFQAALELAPTTMAHLAVKLY
ncbi:Aste57867_11617 [Aphanomyces stellatus]|uniref:dolichyl-phosphate-mannose--protein mannosyltransferase n=1 Tax=Aphanomyces stellatus TaxID=120398 RepID=A0A485KTZ0_9STRA|nr:hypothetical protein As57867_011574 [Aphanomyces stellatus]VFT88475.1 Aste57867_11617 [Aphanomyces stellatus]